MNTLLLITAICLSWIIGLYYGLRAKRHPEFFWTYLINGLIFTSPLAVGGYTWYDEFYTAGFLLANLSRKIKIKMKLSHFVFGLFCFYLLFQSVRGMIFYSQYGFVFFITKIRWTFFFIIVFLVFVKSTSYKICNVFDKNLSYSMTKAGLIFNIIYMAFGLISLFVAGSMNFIQRAMISDIYRVGTSPFLAIFGSTAYVATIYIALIPAALITIKNNVQGCQYIGWVALAVYFMTQVFFNSRSGMLLCLIFFSLFMIQFVLKVRIIKGFLFFIPLVGLTVIFQLYFNEVSSHAIIEDFANTLYLSDSEKHDRALQDIDRKIWNASAVLALADNGFNFLFGWGLRTSGYIVSPYVYDLFYIVRGNAMAKGRESWPEDVSTPGFAALAVDTGVVGLFLLCLVCIFCIIKIYRVNSRIELFLFFAPIAFILQLFVVNNFDILLMYIAIIPFGLFFMLARNNKWTQLGQKRAS